MYSVLHERRNINAPFPKYLKFLEKMTSTEVFWMKRRKKKKEKKRKSKIRTLYVFKLLNTGIFTNEVIPLLLLQSTCNFKNKRDTFWLNCGK